MADQIGPLPSTLRELADAEAAAPAGTLAEREQILARVWDTLGLPGGPGGGGSDPGSAAPGADAARTGSAATATSTASTIAGPLAFKPLAVAVIAAAAIGAGALVGSQPDTPAAPPRPTEIAADVADTTLPERDTVTPHPTVQSSPEVAPAAAISDDEPARAAPHAPPNRTTGSASRPKTAEPLWRGGSVPETSEATLLATAWAQVDRGEPVAAILTLERHAAAYPRGALTEEREALWILALVDGREHDEAIVRAARFDRRHPDSIHRAAIADALASIP